MPLDADRIAEALLEGTKALIAKATAPIIAANAELRAANDAMAARIAQLEAREQFDPAHLEAKLMAAMPVVPEIPDVEALVKAYVPEIDLSGFATKDDVDAVRAAIPEIPAAPDLTGFATKSDVDDVRKSIPAPVELPDLSGFATKDELPQPKDYDGEVASLWDAVKSIVVPDVPDLSGFALKSEIIVPETIDHDLISDTIDARIATATEGLALKSDIPADVLTKADLPEPVDLSGFATKSDVAEVLSSIPEVPASPDLTGFATKADVDAVRAAMPVVPEIDLSGFATKADIPDVAGFVTIDEMRAALPDEPDLSGFATKSEVEDVRKAIPEPVDLSGFATKSDVAEVRASIPEVPAAPDISGFATKADVAVAVATIKMPDVIHGKDGAGIAQIKQNTDGELIVKLTNGETYNAGKVRGEDGFGFDDLTFEYDGERNLSLVWSKGDRVERKEIVLPVTIYRGVWSEGAEYKGGDSVTWAGSSFIAARDTTDKPETSDAWRLAVKRGRDGKNASIPAAVPGTVKR